MRSSLKRSHCRIILIALLAALSACGGSWPGDQPYFSNAAMMGGNGARFGQIMDFPAQLFANTPGSIELVSARLVPLPGFRTPKLVRLALVSGCGLDMPTSGWGWPPRVRLARGGYAKVRNFAGARVWTGTWGKGCYNMAIYGVVAYSFGPYAAGGLRIVFKSDGKLREGTVFDGGFSWYHPSKPTQQEISQMRRDSIRANNAAFNKLDALAHSS